MNIHARIAALHRELADAYQDLADEQDKPKRRRRRDTTRAASDAATEVRRRAKREGFEDGKQA